MALVVAARSPVESAARGARQCARAMQPLAMAGAGLYILALTLDSAARAYPSNSQLDAAAVTALVGSGLLALVGSGVAWLTRRQDVGVLLAATLTPLLVAAQLLIRSIFTTLEQPTLADIVDQTFGLVALATLVWVARGSALGLPGRKSARTEMFRTVTQITALIMLAVSLSGTAVRATGASWACGSMFPDCSGLGALPLGRDPVADVQLYHRLLSYVALGLAAWLAVEGFRTQRVVAGVPRRALVLLGGSLVEAGMGVAVVMLGAPAWGQVAHAFAGSLTWSAAIALVVTAQRAPLTPTVTDAHRRGVTLLGAYVQLTKPRVMSLLLATTAAAMIIAAHGLPDLGVFAATLVGGALMSGGAGAINHYVDRDIDPLMGRTAWRPIPSGVISPNSALRFGIGLSVLAGAVFLVFVNPLACVLAILGLLGYVFIYTLWLKRSTPSNIVIGGAAGAIPPLVGWAAVTNEIGSLTAWYLFAIIFFWTPPHFWALSLLIRKHYERAGVPMLPVVRGEDETRRQILLYAVLLVVLTLVLSPFGMMGWLYFAAAAALGVTFIAHALRLWSQATPLAARKLYLFSILYLFALFTAMAVDRVLG